MNFLSKTKTGKTTFIKHKKMNRYLIIILSILGADFITVSGQEKDPEYGIQFSGFVKNDFFFDTRQTVSVREGHFLLYPESILPDKNGDDINARSGFNFLSIQSRLTGKISGPDAFGAKTSGIMEGAFFGHTNSDINGFRLRHAFLKLNWAETELLFGQFWHLMFVTDCFPGTISFNTGTPFQFFTRNPQIRLSHNIGSLKLSGMIASQRDFSGPGGSSALRNALLPDFQGQIAWKGERFLAGLTAGYKQVVPRLQTDSLYKTTTSVGGLTTQAFLKLNANHVELKFQASYLQNGYDGLSIGGFAVKSIIDPVKNMVDYTTINALNLWADLHSNGEKFQIGIFGGYSVNLGSRERIDNTSNIDQYARGYNFTRKTTESYTVSGTAVLLTKTTTITSENHISKIYRISPRIIFNSGKTRFAFELEHTGAAYGSSIDEYGIPLNTEYVINNRFLAAVYYFF